jgi:hypothetical protein
MAAARNATPPPSPAVARAVAAVKMSSYRAIVNEHRTRSLVDSDGTSYVSPAQTEQQARSLLALLTSATVMDGGGPRRQPLADGQRIIELERRR